MRSWGIAALFALTVMALRWPGTLTPDSVTQLGQATSGHFTDWHPPIMAATWRLLGGSIGAMLAVQCALYWLGIGALADQLRRDGFVRSSYAMLAIGLTPIAVKYLGVIQKDTLLASAMLCAAGLAGRFGRGFAVAPALLGMLSRANGVFALPPLFVRRRSWPLTIALCLALSAALVPPSWLVNHRILGAASSGVETSLMRYDLAGIDHYAGRPSPCYTPLFWDKLLECPATRPGPRQWLGAIAAEPMAYAGHRLAHFNREIFFIVPPMQQCVDAPAYHQCDFTRMGMVKDAIAKNALLWPVTWLVAGVALLFVRPDPVARMLALSGVLYGLAYAVVGVAADFRYFFWTEVAVQAALVWQAARGLRWRIVAEPVAIVWVLGYAARYL